MVVINGSRSPHGERGLKFKRLRKYFDGKQSLPPRGAWIEMLFSALSNLVLRRSLPPRGAWIEIASPRPIPPYTQRSLPPRGAWIEIQEPQSIWQTLPRRSPHGERGLKYSGGTRSSPSRCRSPHGERGLKSVSFTLFKSPSGSLPPRGAWIEMPLNTAFFAYVTVAPPTASVE